MFAAIVNQPRTLLLHLGSQGPAIIVQGAHPAGRVHIAARFGMLRYPAVQSSGKVIDPACHWRRLDDAARRRFDQPAGDAIQAQQVLKRQAFRMTALNFKGEGQVDLLDKLNQVPRQRLT